MSVPLHPGYWRDEETGVVQDAVQSFLMHYELSPRQISVMREYLRQWIMAPVWHGPGVEALRARIDSLTTFQAIDKWLDDALDDGIDPL